MFKQFKGRGKCSKVSRSGMLLFSDRANMLRGSMELPGTCAAFLRPDDPGQQRVGKEPDVRCASAGRSFQARSRHPNIDFWID